MRVARLVALALTIISLVVAAHLELSKDLTTLFPRTPEAEALARVTRAFGGGDVALVLVRGADPERVEHVAEAAATALRGSSSVVSVVMSAPAPGHVDATEAWRFAGPTTRARLANAVTEEGMRERLRETRSLLLAPGAPAAAELLERDPLRLSLIPWEQRLEVASGVRSVAGSAFVADGGRARLVVVEPRGRAFESGEAARFTEEAEAALDRVRKLDSAVKVELTGGHVVARQTELMMRADLQKSGTLSIVLASLVFWITFRRARALVAVLPPLVAGTLWTTALAALLYPRLSAVATAFAAVVVGVGVDTGVHVYGKLLAARREGLTPSAAADAALRETWRPTLGAAVAAAGAFACLTLSDIEGMHQLGVLCAAGEVLTAVAILLVVPPLGALLERKSPPNAQSGAWAVALTSTKRRAIVALSIVGAALAVAISLGAPRLDNAVVALDARTLPAMAVYDAIYDVFGGSRGQLVVVTPDDDEARARARSDAIAETAEQLMASGSVSGFDALGRFAPSPEVQRARLAERDRLDLQSKRVVLQRALRDEGFAVDEFGLALEAFDHPSTNTSDVLLSDDPALSWLRRRHLAKDERGALAIAYVRVTPGAEETVRTAIHAADAGSTITGFADLERGLARTLALDLPRVLGGALLVVVVVLGFSLGRSAGIVRAAPQLGLAVAVLVIEIAIVVGLSRLFGIRWHVYDALVLPVLLGITLDEVLFLLEAIQTRGSVDEALAEQAPLGTATALTTAAGFGALVVCRFGGLVDVGKVGALGSTVGLLVSLVLVPAAYRLRQKQPS